MSSSRLAHSLIALVALAAVGVAGDDLADFIEANRPLVNPRYRPLYHVAGPVGWINDPNGFSFFDGHYHLFYQFHPFSSAWGPMHWGHARSADLVTWEEMPVALRPDQPYDINGCFSGSAVDDDGVLTLIYTGFIEDPAGNKQIQNVAYSTDGVVFTKDAANSVLDQPPEGDFDFRDPKVWKHGDQWYMVIGNPSPQGHGRVILYRSEDLRAWEYLGPLAESLGDVGFMWECPDFFELDGKFVLLISPQGMPPIGDRYHNFYQSGYVVGDFDYETLRFVPNGAGFMEMDYGYDWYAPQTTETKDGRRVVVGWLGMWEEHFEEAEDGWAGLLSIPRELRLDESDRLIMTPAPELLALREEGNFRIHLRAEEGFEVTVSIGLRVSTEVEVRVARPAEGRLVAVVLELGEGLEARLVWRPSDNTLELQRNGDVRRAPFVATDNLECRLFVDASSLEVFCGAAVFSARIYPRSPLRLRVNGPEVELTAHTLRRAVPA